MVRASPGQTVQNPVLSVAHDSLRARFARGALWSLLGALTSQGLGLAASVVTARLLGKEEFGALGMIQSTVGMLGVFAGMGLGLTATKYVAEYQTTNRERAGRIIALTSGAAVLTSGCVSVALLLFAPFLAAKTLNAPHLATELRIACALLFLNTMGGAQTGGLSGFEAFKAIAHVNLLRGLLTFPLVIAGVLLWRLPGAVCGLVCAAGLSCLLNHIALSRRCADIGIAVRWSEAWTERQVLWTFSVPALLSGAMVGPISWLATAILVNQPNGYAEMGLFYAASQWRAAITFLPAVLGQCAFPILSNLHGQNRFGQYREVLWWNIFLTVGTASCVAIPVVLGSPTIMRLYGSSFEDGWLVLALSAGVAILVCLNGALGCAIISARSIWICCLFNGMWGVALVSCALSLVPKGLALGLATSFLLAYAAHAAWQGIYVLRTARSRAPGGPAPC